MEASSAAKVLVVEDDELECAMMCRLLEAHGYRVQCATDGVEAIRAGINFKPHVLINDWILGTRVHGIHVAQVLRMVCGRVKTLLISGYPSSDLVDSAGSWGIFRFLTKPTAPSALLDGIAAALESPDEETAVTPAALLKIGKEGLVSGFNDEGARLLLDAGLNAPLPLERLGSLPDGGRFSLDCPGWTRIIIGPRRTACIAHRASFAADESTLVVLEEINKHLKETLAMRLLIAVGTERHDAQAWPLGERVMVIDDEKLHRKMVVAQLESIGAICHTAADYESAIELLRKDAAIKYVVLDYSMPDRERFPGGLPAFIRILKTLRPSLIIVGNSGMDSRRAFADQGVPLYLQKPWSLQEFSSVIGLNLI